MTETIPFDDFIRVCVFCFFLNQFFIWQPHSKTIRNRLPRDESRSETREGAMTQECLVGAITVTVLKNLGQTLISN